jgi:hypothetical protein
MGALLENKAGCQNGILDPLDARHATGLHATSIHEKGIELDASVGGKKAASPGVESRVILKNQYGSLDSIESGASSGKDRVPIFKGVADTDFVCGRIRCRNCPCTTVNNKDGSVR